MSLLLFFLHGAKLSRESIIAGAGHWRLHLLVFSLTFVLFPILGLALKPLLSPLIGDQLYMGMLYLCALPATVQSAIAFTSLARGNIPAAICSAAASSLFGIFLTPLLVTLLLNVHGDGDVPAVFLTLGDDAGRDLFRGRSVDRRAVVGAPVLGRRAGG